MAQDSARFTFQWNEYDWSFEKDFKDFMPGWYYGYSDEYLDVDKKISVLKAGLCIQKNLKSKIDFTQDTIGWSSLGFEIDSNSLIAPKTQMKLFYPNGKVKAIVDILPFFVRQKTLKELIASYDTIAADDGEGNLAHKLVKMEASVFDLPFREYKIIKHGYLNYYDTLGNQISQSFYQFGKVKSGAEGKFNDAYEPHYTKYFLEDGDKVRKVYYSEDSLERIETVYYNYYNDDLVNQEIETKVYFNSMLKYERIFQLDKKYEQWYNSEGKIIQTYPTRNGKACGLTPKSNLYFKLSENLDTLERGYFVNGLKHGHWEQFDTSAAHNLIFSGDFLAGQGIGKHSFYRDGKLYREIYYKQFKRADANKDGRFQNIVNQNNWCSIYEVYDSVFYRKDYEVFYYEYPKVKQKIFYDAYHYYRYDKESCFDDTYMDISILDGVYTSFPHSAKIPEFYVGRKYEIEDKSIIYSKINYDVLEQETSRLFFVNGRAFEGRNIIYDFNGNLNSINDYRQGRIVER